MGSVTGPPLPPTAPRAPALAAAVPFFAMAVVAGADLLAGPQIGFLPLLSLGPALAPVSLGPARTVLTGVLALLLSGLLASYDGPQRCRLAAIRGFPSRFLHICFRHCLTQPPACGRRQRLPGEPMPAVPGPGEPMPAAPAP